MSRPSPESELWPPLPGSGEAAWSWPSSNLAGEDDKDDISSGASWVTSEAAVGGRSVAGGGSLRPMIELIRNGLTAEAADWDVFTAPGDPEVALIEACVAATAVELRCNRLKRPLEATTCDAMTSAGEASTMAAVTTIFRPRSVMNVSKLAKWPFENSRRDLMEKSNRKMNRSLPERQIFKQEKVVPPPCFEEAGWPLLLLVVKIV